MFMSLFGFKIGMMFASFHVWRMILLSSDMLYMLVIYANPSGHVREVHDADFIRPCGVVFALFYCRLDLCCCESYFSCIQFVCYLYVCLCVLCLTLTVLVNCLLNEFANCVGEVNIFSLKVIVLFLGCAVFWWLIRVWSSKEYVCCVCDPSVFLPYARIVCLYEGCDFRV